MLLAQQVLLLLTDERTGAARSPHNSTVVAGAVLTDLALRGSLRVTEPGEDVRKDRVVIVPDTAWPDDPLLATAMLTAGRKAHWSAPGLAWALSSKLDRAVYERLVQAEVVSRVEHRALRWPVIDLRPLHALLDEIDETVLFGKPPGTRCAALLGLLSASGALVKVLDRGRGIDRKAVKALGLQLRRQYWGAEAAYQAIQAQNAAAAG